MDLLITNTSEVLTCSEEAGDLIGLIPNADVAIRDGEVIEVGVDLDYTTDEIIDAEQGVVMPGFVDAHTHVVFGDSRLDEYAAKVAGNDPPSDAPVGILGTVESTRNTAYTDLYSQTRSRIAEMLKLGTTTIESKSGYGLEPETELEILRVNNQLEDELPVDIVSTYLGAHAFPPNTEPSNYVGQVVDLITQVSKNEMAEFIDVYCDEGYFTLSQSRKILNAGLEQGLGAKLHLDAYSHTGAASLATELGAVSVDHMNYTPRDELRALADSGVVGVYMPSLEFTVDHPNPFDVTSAIEEGMEVALATDMCPGCWVTSMPLTIALACRHGGMSVEQAIRAATYGAAKAIDRHDQIGSIERGMQADLIILDVRRHEELAYRVGRDSVSTVIKEGEVAISKGK